MTSCIWQILYAPHSNCSLNFATFLGKAIGPNLCALLARWNHRNLIEPEWNHFLREGLGRPELGTCGEAYKQECASSSHCQCSFAPWLGAGGSIVTHVFLVGFHHGCWQYGRNT